MQLAWENADTFVIEWIRNYENNWRLYCNIIIFKVPIEPDGYYH